LPLLPAYFQAAPEDQQVDSIMGGEPVILLNVTADGRRDFHLPSIEVPIAFLRRRGERHHTGAKLDTVVFEPDAQRFVMVWRATLLLKQDIFEVAQVVVGQRSRAWWRAVDIGKTYYPSLGKLAEHRRAAPETVE
jgi:hypothetical protein